VAAGIGANVSGERDGRLRRLGGISRLYRKQMHAV
jgi:hypothetical protein